MGQDVTQISGMRTRTQLAKWNLPKTPDTHPDEPDEIIERDDWTTLSGELITDPAVIASLEQRARALEGG